MSAAFWSTVTLVLEILVVVLAVVIAPRNRSPSAALAWIFVMAALPIAGLIAFLLIGSPKLPAHRRDIQRGADERLAELTSAVPAFEGEPEPRWLPAIAGLNRSVGALPMLDGNDAHLLSHFDEQLAALIETVDAATRFLHVEFYILALDATTAPFFAALGRAEARGVSVRVLLDHLGTQGYPGYAPAKKELTRLGIDWHLMLPVQPWKGRYQRPDLRNHRKLLVADGREAYVGSMNLIDPSYQKAKNRRRGLQWRDLMMRVHGPVVREVDAIFATDWFSETGERLATASEPIGDDERPGGLLCQVAPSGPAYPGENNLALFTSLIFAAEKRLSITSPYFVPDDSLMNAITTAARRGIAVELFVGEIGDQFGVFHAQHSYYAALLDAGVRIWLYPGPAILHTKAMSVDGVVGVVGSSNMDIRSFQLDFEVTMLVAGRSLIAELEAVEDDYRGRSRELTAAEWAERSFAHSIVDNTMRLTSAVQ